MFKKIAKAFLGLLLVILAAIVFHCTAILHFSGKEGSHVDPILSTNWQQVGGFNKYTPDQARIGCWGTAFAQIMYHHRVLPSGVINYQTSAGQVMEADLSDFAFNFDLFDAEIGEQSSTESIDQMAMYNYFSALAVHKDFGTDNGSTIHMTKVGKELEAHYPVKTNWYACIDGWYPYTPKKLESIVEKELYQGRPLYFYFWDGGANGHAVVIDGYKREDGQFKVHLIQGQGGKDNGWYDFHGPILAEGDVQTRLLYTVKPRKNDANK